MTSLSDTQAIVLAAAAQRPDGDVLSLPGSLRGGAASKVITALLTRGLVRETVTDSITRLLRRPRLRRASLSMPRAASRRTEI